MPTITVTIDTGDQDITALVADLNKGACITDVTTTPGRLTFDWTPLPVGRNPDPTELKDDLFTAIIIASKFFGEHHLTMNEITARLGQE